MEGKRFLSATTRSYMTEQGERLLEKELSGNLTPEELPLLEEEIQKASSIRYQNHLRNISSLYMSWY